MEMQVFVQRSPLARKPAPSSHAPGRLARLAAAIASGAALVLLGRQAATASTDLRRRDPDVQTPDGTPNRAPALHGRRHSEAWERLVAPDQATRSSHDVQAQIRVKGAGKAAYVPQELIQAQMLDTSLTYGSMR